MVSYPTYENNPHDRVIPAYYYNQLSQDPLHPMLNHAISAELPPGSVYKMAAAIGALNEGVVTPDEQIECPGMITVTEKYSTNDPGRQQPYYSYDRTGHGICDFLKGVSLSDDVYFYKIGGGFQDEVPNGGLNVWRLQQYAQALGYGTVSGIELPGEAQGLVPDPTWKRINQFENWSVGDTYIATIGQGYVLSTPLQVLESFATLANNGAHMKPTLIKEITDAQGNVIKPFTPQLLWDITKDPVINVLDDTGKPTGEKKTVEPWVIDYAKQGMREVVVSGTASEISRTLILNCSLLVRQARRNIVITLPRQRIFANRKPGRHTPGIPAMPPTIILRSWSLPSFITVVKAPQSLRQLSRKCCRLTLI